MSFALADGNGNIHVPCKGCKLNPCDALNLLKDAEKALNQTGCKIAVDFGVVHCIFRVPLQEFHIGPVR